jgi:hypothetical protein
LFAESVGPSETPQERSNRLRRKRQTIQQATARAQPSLSNYALQLFIDEDASAPARWDCGKMDTIRGFCNENVDERTIGKVEQQQPTVFSVL